MKRIITFGVICYNVKPYIAECLDSVIRQRGDDIEIIVVDDGSNDGGSDICDLYARRDSRIRVLHRENGGASAARNAVIDEAVGDWICFVDGDDMLTDGAADIIRNGINEKHQIVFFDAVFFHTSKTAPEYKSGLASLEISVGNGLETLLLDTVYKSRSCKGYVNVTTVSAWGKAFRTSFLKENGLTFDLRLRKGQDIAFSLACAMKLENAVFIRQCIYRYRLNEKSMVNRYNPFVKDYNELLISACGEIIGSYTGFLKNELEKRMLGLAVMQLKIAAELDFCHRDNKKPYAERKKDFLEYISRDYYRKAIEGCDASELQASDAYVLRCAEQKDFAALCIRIAEKTLVKRLKRAAAYMGLGRLKRLLKYYIFRR